MGVDYTEKDAMVGHNVGGFGGGAMGIFMAVALLVIVFFFIFRRDGRDGYGDGYGLGGALPYAAMLGYGKGKCCECETNCEVDRHLTDKLWHNDRDILETACKTQEKVCSEEEKTRALIRHEAERAEDKAYQAMLYEGVKKDTEIAMLKTELNTQGKFNCLERDIDNKFCMTNGNISGGFCRTDNLIERGFCETPKRPPYWSAGMVDDGYPIPPRHSRRECCEN